MKFTLLFYPLLSCLNVYRDCSGLLQSRTISTTELVYLAQEIAVLAEMGFLLALFLFLIRWHFLNRLELLEQKLTNE